MRLELVQEWMSRDVVTAVPDMLLLDADKLMKDHGIRRLPVVDENGRLLGIVTYGDIREARPSSASSLSSWEMNYLLANLTLGEVMTKEPTTVTPGTMIGEAASKMLHYRISGLPVVDEENHVVGIITESDIFRMVARDWERLQAESTQPYAHYGE